MLRKRLAILTGGAAVLAVALAGVGLAAGGVDLPGLTNGAAPQHPSGSSSNVLSIIQDTPPSERGCEFGQDVAAAARGEALPSQAQAACNHGDNRSRRHRPGSNHAHGRAGVNPQSSEGSDFGQDTAERAKSLGSATPEQRQQFGQDTAQGAQQLGAQPDTASTPQGGPGTGETHSEAGRSVGEQASGGHGP